MAEEKLFTQEEVNKLVGAARLEGKESGKKAFEGYISPEELAKKLEAPSAEIADLKTQIQDLQATISEKNEKIAEGDKYKTDLEKTRIALSAGLKVEYADRLKGENAEEWKADAELLAKDFAASHVTAPIASPEPQTPKDLGTAAKKAFETWIEQTEGR